MREGVCSVVNNVLQIIEFRNARLHSPFRISFSVFRLYQTYSSLFRPVPHHERNLENRRSHVHANLSQEVAVVIGFSKFPGFV